MATGDKLTQQRIAEQKQQLQEAGYTEKEIREMGPAQRSATQLGVASQQKEVERIQQMHAEGKLSPTSIKEYQEQGILPAAAKEPTAAPKGKPVVTGEQLKKMTTAEFQKFYEKRGEYAVIPSREVLRARGETIEQWSERAGYDPKSVIAARKAVEAQERARAAKAVQEKPPEEFKPRPKGELLEEYSAGIPGAGFQTRPVISPLKPPKYEFGVSPELLGTVSEAKITERIEASKAEVEWAETWISPKPEDPFYVQIGKGAFASIGAPLLMAGEVSRTVHDPEFRTEFAGDPLGTLGKQAVGFGTGMAEMAFQYPIYTAALFFTPTLIKRGLGKIGVIKPKYEVTYLRSVRAVREWRITEVGAIDYPMRARVSILYKPKIKVSPTFLLPKEYLKPTKPMVMLGKPRPFYGEGISGLVRIDYGTFIKAVTFKKIVKGAKPVIPEVIPAISFRGVKMLGKRFISGKDVLGAILIREKELMVPIKLPDVKSAIIKKARPLGDLGKMKPFGVPRPGPPVKPPGPVKPGAMGRVKFRGPLTGLKWPEPIPISARVLPELGFYEYIAPAAAGVLGITEPKISMQRQKLKLSYAPAHISQQRQLEQSMKQMVKLAPKMEQMFKTEMKFKTIQKIDTRISTRQMVSPRMDVKMKVEPMFRPIFVSRFKPKLRLRERPMDILKIGAPAVPGTQRFFFPFPSLKGFKMKFRIPGIGALFGPRKKYRPSLGGLVSGRTILAPPKFTLTGIEMRPPVRRKKKKRR